MRTQYTEICRAQSALKAAGVRFTSGTIVSLDPRCEVIAAQSAVSWSTQWIAQVIGFEMVRKCQPVAGLTQIIESV